MTNRTKIYIRNEKGKRVHLIILKGLKGEQVEAAHKQLQILNSQINE